MGRNILIVFPHPDDESFGNGGTFAKHANSGDNITLICATLGQMGRRMGKPFFANRETLPKLREKELKDACKELGINDVRLWRMQDKTLQFRDPVKLADRIYSVIEEIKPSNIYSFYPKHGVHPDHDALSAAAAIAVARLPKENRPIFYGSAITRNRIEELGQPNVEADVSDVIDRKISALKAHRSQTELIIKKLEKEIAENPDKEQEIMSPYMKEYFWVYNFMDESRQSV